jgi:hypothetical protein
MIINRLRGQISTNFVQMSQRMNLFKDQVQRNSVLKKKQTGFIRAQTMLSRAEKEMSQTSQLRDPSS